MDGDKSGLAEGHTERKREGLTVERVDGLEDGLL